VKGELGEEKGMTVGKVGEHKSLTLDAKADLSHKSCQITRMPGEETSGGQRADLPPKAVKKI